MAVVRLLSSLVGAISPASKILMDQGSSDFQTSMERWSNLDKETPYGIVQPATEQDIVLVVQKAVELSVPFVPVAGGHSTWSSIGKDGIVIDLSTYRGVTVDEARSVATVKGGTLSKQLQTALHHYKRFAAVGSGGTVGVVPYNINGGISTYTPFAGYGCENIVSAKLVNAKGELVEVSESQNPDLLWAIRGAGQFFGLITELVIKTYPYSMLGNEEGQRICGTYVFLPHQVDAVSAAIEQIAKSDEYVSAGHFMIAQAPTDPKQQVLLVAPQIFCSLDDAAKFFQSLKDIGPIQEALMPSTFGTHSDHLDWIGVKGEFKRFNQIGLKDWNTPNIKKLVQLHSELVANCPDAARCVYSIEWHTPCKGQREPNTSFGLEDVHFWLNVLNWYSDASNHEFVDAMDKKAQAAMRVGAEVHEHVSYTNSSRVDPIASRYKGADRVSRLKALKKEYDPKGVFTRELL